MKEKEKMLLVTEQGIVGSKLTASEVMSMLLYAYLNVWNDEMFEIDTLEAAKKIIDLMETLRKEEDKMSLYDLFSLLFEDNKEEEKE